MPTTLLNYTSRQNFWILSPKKIEKIVWQSVRTFTLFRIEVAPVPPKAVEVSSLPPGDVTHWQIDIECLEYEHLLKQNSEVEEKEEAG